MIRFDAGVFTECGSFRKTNEDSFLLCGRSMSDGERTGSHGISTGKRKFGVAAVFDGMGGAKYGELASGMCAEILIDYMESILNLGRMGVDSFVRVANEAVCEKSIQYGAPMGSTMALISVSDESVSVYNIGDSRAYIVRSGQIKQLSKDHTVSASLSSIGIENKSAGREHQLTQYLGIPSDELVVQAFSLGCFKLKSRDRILLCSDGVTDALTDKQILSLLSQEKTAADLAVETVRAAQLRGSRDNITAMVFVFADDGRQAARYDTPARRKAATARVQRERLLREENQQSADSVMNFIESGPLYGAQTKNRPDARRGRPAPFGEPGGKGGIRPSAFSPAGAGGKDRFWLFWLCNVILAFALGAVIRIIYGLL